MTKSAVATVSFGCRLNAHESATIGTLAEAAGHDQLTIVNTCAVTAEAVRQARQNIRRLKREQPNTRIVVTGCAAQTEPRRFAEMPEVTHVIGNTEKLDPVTWRDLAEKATPRVIVGDIMTNRSAGGRQAGAFEGRARASVQVQNGCDHRCTFCIIPFGRGNSRSAPLEEVVAQVRQLVEKGYNEVVLTGVDLTAYGADLADAPRLGGLVKTILRQVPELLRLRLSSIDSIEADRDLIDAFATEARLMPHLHLSLQSGDDLILKRMKRRHGRVDSIAFCAELRRLRPDIVFGADLIAGFPTEDEAMFQHSCDIVGECGLTHLHIFPYSARPGTPAVRMPAVAGPVIADRAARLREVGAQALRMHCEAQVGGEHRVLVERGSVGHTEGFTRVRLTDGAPLGQVVTVQIADTDGRELRAA